MIFYLYRFGFKTEELSVGKWKTKEEKVIIRNEHFYIMTFKSKQGSAPERRNSILEAILRFGNYQPTPRPLNTQTFLGL